jgi:hypothetical protein
MPESADAPQPTPTNRRAPATSGGGGKDGWDKLATLTTLISSVVIGAAGVAATYIYNNRELQIKHDEKVAEEKRLNEQAKEANELEITTRLEVLFKYVSSEKANEREFGYEMFQALGHEDLAVKIISLKQDPAGEAVARSAAQSANPQTAAQARAISGTLRLAHWLRQDGAEGTIDQSRANALIAWMKGDSNLADIPLHIFVGDNAFEAERQKAIAELGIP